MQILLILLGTKIDYYTPVISDVKRDQNLEAEAKAKARAMRTRPSQELRGRGRGQFLVKQGWVWKQAIC